MNLFQDLPTPDEVLETVATHDECGLVDVDHVAFASIEDGRIFLIHDETLSDEHPIIAPVIELARRAGLAVESDITRDSGQYLSLLERVRWFA